MAIGLKSIVITPRKPVELATRRAGRGIGVPCSVTRTELMASILVWSGEHAGVIVALDLAWIDREFCERFRSRLAPQIDARPEAIWLSASHTHSAPQVVPGIPFYGGCDDDYREQLMNDLEDAVLAAWQDRSAGRLGAACEIDARLPVSSRTSFGGRLGFGRRIFNAPDPRAATDTEVRCAFVRDAEELKGVIFSVSCHPIFFWGNECHGEFPARVRERIHQAWGESVEVVFLQGFCGNLKPWYHCGIPLRRRLGALAKFGSLQRVFGKLTDEHEHDFAGRIFDAIVEAERQPENATENRHPSLPARECLINTAAGSNREPAVAVSRMSLPNGTTLVAMSGEPFYSYRRSIGNCWPVGYTNGMHGYLVDQEIVEAGHGYEFTSWEKFGHRGPLSADDCRRFVAALEESSGELAS